MTHCPGFQGSRLVATNFEALRPSPTTLNNRTSFCTLLFSRIVADQKWHPRQPRFSPLPSVRGACAQPRAPHLSSARAQQPPRPYQHPSSATRTPFPSQAASHLARPHLHRAERPPNPTAPPSPKARRQPTTSSPSRACRAGIAAITTSRSRATTPARRLFPVRSAGTDMLSATIWASLGIRRALRSRTS